MTSSPSSLVTSTSLGSWVAETAGRARLGTRWAECVLRRGHSRIYIHLKLDEDIYQWMAMCRRKKKTAMRKRTLSTRRQVAWRCHAPAPPSTTATTSTSSEVRQHEMEMLITWC